MQFHQGTRLKKIIKEKKVTHAFVIEKTGLHSATYYRMFDEEQIDYEKINKVFAAIDYTEDFYRKDYFNNNTKSNSIMTAPFLALNLKNIRKKIGLTAFDFAARLGMSVVDIAKYEESDLIDDVPNSKFVAEEIKRIFNYQEIETLFDKDISSSVHNFEKMITLEIFKSAFNKLEDTPEVENGNKIIKKTT